MRFELIFVRHGESCANVLLKEPSWKKKILHKGYTDPELSTRGRLLSEQKANRFTAYLEELGSTKPFAHGEFTLAASPLFRAQETAYLMVGRNNTKPIYVFPHIGEIGFAEKLEVFQDNKAYPKHKQKEMFLERYPNLDVEFFFPDEKDKREDPPDFEAFLEWIPHHLDYFQKGSDGVYRAVIVSHSNFLKEVFPFTDCLNPPSKLPDKEKLDNNDFLVSIFELGPAEPVNNPEYLVPKAVYPKWHYFDTRMLNEDEKPTCGQNAMCRKKVNISKGCITKGGKRKTQRRRRSRSKLQRLSKKIGR